MRRRASRFLFWCSLMALEPERRAIALEVQELGWEAYEAESEEWRCDAR